MLEKLFKKNKTDVVEENVETVQSFDEPTQLVVPDNHPRPRTGVCFYDRKVWVNREKKVVAVKQYACVDMCRNEFYAAQQIPEIQAILDGYRNVHPSHKCTAYVDNRGFLMIEATGTARCNDVDEFDEDLGVKLATTRAQERIFAATGNFFDTVVHTIGELFMNKFEGYAFGNWLAAIQCVDHEFELQGINDNEQ